MGEYFYYANHDKRLLFDVGLGGFSLKFSGIGRSNIANRAFSLLLTKSDHYNHIYRKTLIGSWIGDYISVIGDQTKWEYQYDSYRNITANVIMMLYQIDGAEYLIEAAKISDCFFIQLGYLIFTNQFKQLLPEFNQAFEDDWSKKHKEILQNSSYRQCYDLVDLD